MWRPTVWNFIAARATGSSHLRNGAPCQDQFACESLPSGGLVAAVADGAGSAANSERGAEIAVRATVAVVLAAVTAGRTDFGVLLREAALCAREAVIAEAAGAGSPPSSYASTLLALVITPEGGAAAQIGDGVIVFRAQPADLTGFSKPVRSFADGSWHYVTWPQHGEYINSTFFLTRDDAAERLEVVPLDASITEFALTTDGLESLVLHYDTRTVHAPFFDAMTRPLIAAEDTASIDRLSAALGAFLASDRISSRTDDDVTLLLATCQGHAAEPVAPTPVAPTLDPPA